MLINQHSNYRWESQAPAYPCSSNFGTGGGYLKDLYTTYVAYQPSEADDGGSVLSPPSLTFLQPGRPGLKGVCFKHIGLGCAGISFPNSDS